MCKIEKRNYKKKLSLLCYYLFIYFFIISIKLWVEKNDDIEHISPTGTKVLTVESIQDESS